MRSVVALVMVQDQAFPWQEITDGGAPITLRYFNLAFNLAIEAMAV